MRRKIRSETQRKRLRRAQAVRKKISGSAERPRLSIYRSTKHIYAQLIDDDSGKTIAATSTLEKGVKEQVAEMKKMETAETVGKRIAELAKEKGITTVLFDRNGWRYHGRVAALAKGAREGGLEF